MNRAYMFSVFRKISNIALGLQIVLILIESIIYLPQDLTNIIRMLLITVFLFTALALPWIKNSSYFFKFLGLTGIVLFVLGLWISNFYFLAAILPGVFILFITPSLESVKNGSSQKKDNENEPFPASGPAKRAGRSKNFFKYYISSTLALFNPFQLFQMIFHTVANIFLSELENFQQKGKYSLPFAEEWLVLNGGIEKNISHSWDIINQRYAYDFVMSDCNNKRHKSNGDDLKDYYCYGKNILSPGSGRVIKVKDGIRDYPRPGTMALDFIAKDFRGNFVIIKHEDKEYSFIAHFIPGSIEVKEGDCVKRGQVIGKCGNSGHSTEPHLHLHFQDNPSFYLGRGIPIKFSNLKINDEYKKDSYIKKGERVLSLCSTKLSVSELEEKLIALNEELELKQFENYYMNQDHDLNKINRRIYKILSAAPRKAKLTGRREEVFNSTYYRYMVENSPEVAGLRNKLDIGRRRKEYIDNDYTDSLDDEPLADRSELRREMALNMRDDVIELMRRRNDRAKDLGFDSYPDLIYSCSELQRKDVERAIEDYLQSNLERANEIIEKYNRKHDLDLNRDNYFKKLRGLLSFAESREPVGELKKYFSELGYDDLLSSLTVYEQEEISGIVMAVSIPDDVRMMITPLDSLWKLKVFYHECGHAACYSSIREDGIYGILSTFYDELMAVLFENIAGEIFFEAEEKKMYKEFQLLEAVRCSISFLFEAELWNSPEEAEELFRRYQKLLDLPAKEDCKWTLDTFRSLDPVYMHNYVLGEIYSQRIVDQLKQEYGADYVRWGKEIRDIMEAGMRIPLQKKIDKLTF